VINVISAKKTFVHVVKNQRNAMFVSVQNINGANKRRIKNLNLYARIKKEDSA
jgi:hypothetical protein